MRWRRAATVGLAAFALLGTARPAAGVTYIGLHDLTCDGAITEGTGLPERTPLDVALVDPASKKTLSRDRVTTRASGTFESRAEVTLSGMVDSRAVRRRAEDIAEGVSGVTHVQNNMRVQTATAAVGTSSTTGTTGTEGGTTGRQKS